MYCDFQKSAHCIIQAEGMGLTVFQEICIETGYI